MNLTMPSNPGPVVAIVGPTATGKSDLALDLAQRFAGEIVGADASQLYRGMDIGTAKLPPGERRNIPHHQIDVLDLEDEATIAGFQKNARADIAAIGQRGRLPILVGGSGLYIRAALDRLELPPTDEAVRARWEHRLAEVGVETLYHELTLADPAAASAIEPRNGRRIVRALEVIELTGQPFSATAPAREYVAPTLVIGLRRDRVDLDARIDQRTAAMWRAGFVAEVEHLRSLGLERGRTASRAVGYAQVLSALRGEISATEALTATVAATKRLVRRQETWFRPDHRIQWVHLGNSARSLEVARDDIVARVDQHLSRVEAFSRTGRPWDDASHG